MNFGGKIPLLRLSLVSYVGIALFVSLSLYCLWCISVFSGGVHSTLEWLFSMWIPQLDMEHGWLIPPLSAFMVCHALKDMKDESPKCSMHGLWSIALGALLFVLSVRTQQTRIAAASVPFLFFGPVWYYLGNKAALKCAFPFAFLFLAVPMPAFQHATVGLQLLSADAAHWGASMCGVETIQIGTNIASADGSWDAYNIVGGCSGIRSLMALLMISTAWAYLANKLSWWKRVILALSAVPLAILGNAFRVTSIFVCAEYINPAFAGKTWHDWSGLLFFFPITLFGLAVLHSILAGEIPFLNKRKVVVRKNNTLSVTEEKGEQQ